MKRLLITLSVIAASLEAFCAQVAGPDGKLVLTTNVQDGRAVYSVVYDGKAILLDSPLGFESNIGNYCDGLTLVSDTVSEFKADFKQDRIKHYHVKWDANRLVEEFSNKNGAKFSIEWLVGNNDIAFRYIISKVKDTGSMNINKENTGFRFPGNTTTFLTPQSKAMTGWKRTKPSYEEKYTVDAPMNTPSQYGKGYTFPAMFKVGDNGWVLVSETGVDGSFCGSRLSDYSDGYYSIEYPMHEENNVYLTLKKGSGITFEKGPIHRYV